MTGRYGQAVSDAVRVSVKAAGTLPARVSPSQVSTWRSCQLRYFFASIARWREPETAATVTGTLVHSALESLYRTPAAERTEQRAQELLHGQATRLFGDPVYAGFRSDDTIHQRATAAVANVFVLEDPTVVEVHGEDLEASIATEIDGVSFVGRLDRRTRTGVCRVSDYKSGQRPAPPFLPDKLAQLYLYAAAVDACGDPADEVELMFLGSGHRTRRPIYPAVLGHARAMLRQMRTDSEQALADRQFVASPGPLCRWCKFARACPAKSTSCPIPGTADSDARLREAGLRQTSPPGTTSVAAPGEQPHTTRGPSAADDPVEFPHEIGDESDWSQQ